MFVDELLVWLNRESSNGRWSEASRQRVLTLRDAVSKALAHAGKRPTAELTAILRTINRRMSDYPMKSSVSLSGKGVLSFIQGSGPGKPQGEQLAAWALVALADTGHFDLLRKCECGRWYFAKRKDQKGHDAQCARKVYEQTEEYKARKRKKARERYELHKSGKVREGRG